MSQFGPLSSLSLSVPHPWQSAMSATLAFASTIFSDMEVALAEFTMIPVAKRASSASTKMRVRASIRFYTARAVNCRGERRRIIRNDPTQHIRVGIAFQLLGCQPALAGIQAATAQGCS